MATKRHHEEHVNTEAWAIPYGDLITLLLAFFVVMYSMSSVNEGKYRVLSDSLAEAFGGTPKAMTPIQLGSQQQRGSKADSQITVIAQHGSQTPAHGSEHETGNPAPIATPI